MKIEKSYRHLTEVVAAQIVFEAACLQASVRHDDSPAQRRQSIDNARQRVAAIVQEADDVARQEVAEILATESLRLRLERT